MVVLRSLTPAAAPFMLAGDPTSCPSDIPMSCHNTTVVENTCCFIPQGQLLLTQFWDTEPVTGPIGKSQVAQLIRIRELTV